MGPHDGKSSSIHNRWRRDLVKTGQKTTRIFGHRRYGFYRFPCKFWSAKLWIKSNDV